MLDQLGQLQERYPGVLADVRGLGLLIGMEFPNDGIGFKIASGFFSRGVLTAGILTNSKVIRNGYKAILPILAKTFGFAVPIFPSLIFNKKYSGHNILRSTFLLMF